MESPNRPKSAEVDQLRGAAALLVLFYHSMHTGAATIGIKGWLITTWFFPAVLYEGHTGVAMFMVLSGYILASGTFGKDISYAGFLRNRLLRIFPLMTVILVFSLYTSKDQELGQIIAPFLLLGNTKAAFTDPSGLAGMVWTIAVEFQFYLIAPFVFALVDRHRLPFLLSAMLFFWLLRMTVLLPLHADPDQLYRVSYYTIAGRINQFMIGVALAYLFERDILKLDRKTASVLLIGAGIAILVLLNLLNRAGGIYVWSWWRILYPEIEGLLWAVFIAAFLISRPLKGRRAASVVSSIGAISFSIYILHYALQREFWNIAYPYLFPGWVSSPYGVLITTALISIPILAMSALSYKCIEKPFIDMRGKYLTPRLASVERDVTRRRSV